MNDQAIVFSILASTLLLFVHGGLRYDLVALLALLAVVLTGQAPAQSAFAGFGHPAVITVAAVLVISRGLAAAGIVDIIASRLARLGDSFTLQLAALTGLVTIASGFMNNVGALALMMPVAIRIARTHDRSPSLMLMPLAFGSLLGGTSTLIGTPPNIIISAMREEALGQGYGMFDFFPVGAWTALAGVAFLCLAGWRLLPRRQSQGRDDLYHIETYITELRIPEASPLVGRTLRALEELAELDVVVVGLERGDHLLGVPSDHEVLEAGDFLIVEASPHELERILKAGRLELRGSKTICARLFKEHDVYGPIPVERGTDCGNTLKSSHMDLMETVVGVNSRLVGRSVLDLNLRHRFGMNLLAISRQGHALRQGLKRVRFRPGDVLLLQGADDVIRRAIPRLGCLPLAERELRLGRPEHTVRAAAIFAAGIALATSGLMPVEIALTLCACLMVLTGVLNLREAYEGIEWPVIILLGAMFPLGQALESSGGARSVADALLSASHMGGPALGLALLLAATMLLSNIVNNAAAAVLMAPIALKMATGYAVHPDPLLMAVCIGCSTPFLTPIGHQSNTLVMGPGGYRFRDYWPMGLPLSVLVVAVAVPLILHFWPF